MPVEPFDFECVVEQIAAHGRVVGKEGRHIDVLEFLSGAQTGAFFIRAVGLMPAVPETERLARFSIFEEVLKIFRIILGADTLGRRLQFVLRVLGPAGLRVNPPASVARAQPLPVKPTR